MRIYCCGCEEYVDARLTCGKEIYPHRVDLYDLPFWKCDTCGNYIGCHHKTTDRTKPLGVIPTDELRRARHDIHKLMDPIWRGGEIKRADLYKMISDEFGFRYHTAKIKSIEDARKIYKFIENIRETINGKNCGR